MDITCASCLSSVLDRLNTFDSRVSFCFVDDRLYVDITNSDGDIGRTSLGAFGFSSVQMPRVVVVLKYGKVLSFSFARLFGLCLYSRLCQMRDKPVIFPRLFYKDVKHLLDLCVSSMPHSEGALFKLRSRAIVFNLSSFMSEQSFHAAARFESGKALAEILFSSAAFDFDKDLLTLLSRHFTILPSSESALSESNVLCLLDKSDAAIEEFNGVFRSKGCFIEGDHLYSLYPPKSSLPARLKTHATTDSFIIDGQETVRALTLFLSQEDIEAMPEIFEDAFTSGVIECSKKFSSVTCEMTRKQTFNLSELSLPEKGLVNADRSNRVFVGKSLSGRPVWIERVKSIEVLSISQLNNDKFEVKFISRMPAGNARIVSVNGLKGVTKTMQNMPYLTIDGEDVEVQLLCAGNSMKAKKANLLYSPDEQNGATRNVEPVLCTIYRGGKIYTFETRNYAYIDVHITEVGSLFASFKGQRLSFNALRFIEESSPELSQLIREDYIHDSVKNTINELLACYYDKTIGCDKSIPRYHLHEIKRLFDVSRDCLESMVQIIPSSSILLKDEFNKGFYIDLTHIRPGYFIRVPSAETFLYLTGESQDGDIVYPGILLEISKTIRYLLEGKKSHYLILPNANEENQQRICSYNQYKEGIKGVLYRSELGGQSMIQQLMCPIIPGVSIKQVHDKYVPDGVVVLLDDNIYERFIDFVYKEDKTSTPSIMIYNRMKPTYAFTSRNPFLWRTQTIVSKVWGREEFNDHLIREYGFELKDYLSIKDNRYCALIGKDILRMSHSDCDGDLIQICAPEGYEMQHLMEHFKLANVHHKMLEWDESYIQKEALSALVPQAELDKPFEVFSVPIGGKDGYLSLLADSALAKRTVGLSTNNAWVFTMLLYLYKGLKEAGDPIAILPWSDSGQTLAITEKNAALLDHIYTETNERYVVNAIKHIKGGAFGYEKFLIRIIGKATSRADINEVMHSIKQEMGYSHTDAAMIINLCLWAVQTKALDYCSDFIKLHNKGQLYRNDGTLVNVRDKETKEWFDRILNNTFIGSLYKESFTTIEKAVTGEYHNEEVYPEVNMQEAAAMLLG